VTKTERDLLGLARDLIQDASKPGCDTATKIIDKLVGVQAAPRTRKPKPEPSPIN
jgi:hypothetical protein